MQLRCEPPLTLRPSIYGIKIGGIQLSTKTVLDSTSFNSPNTAVLWKVAIPLTHVLSLVTPSPAGVEKYEIVELYTGNLGEWEMLENCILSEEAEWPTIYPAKQEHISRNLRWQYGRQTKTDENKIAYMINWSSNEMEEKYRMSWTRTVLKQN